MVRLELTTVIDAPIERVFDVSRSVDAHEASMRATGEQAIAGILSGPMSLGDTVTWRARHFGIWWRLQSQITACQRPVRFVDEQIAGPFKLWYHEHLFGWDTQKQVTVMVDRIRFAAPGGPIGWIAERVVLRHYLRKLILRRNDFLARHAVLD